MGNDDKKKSNFGRDLGLLHELCVTGRSCGVTSKLYGYLAHHSEYFSKVAILTRHQQVLDEAGIEATAVDERLAEKLIEDVGRIVDGCMACNFSGSTASVAEAIWLKKDGRELYLHYGFGPEADAEVKRHLCFHGDSYEGIDDWRRAVEIYDEIYQYYVKVARGKRVYGFVEEDKRISHFHYHHHIAFTKMLMARLKEIQISPQELAEFSASFEWRDDRLWVSKQCGTGYFFEDTFVPVIRQIVRRRAILSLLRQL